jgi:SAM-dependent methyltransferase
MMDSPADAIIGLYERHAQRWDAVRGRSLFERKWLDAFAAGLPDGGTVLDLGCGAGEPIARYLVEEGFRVWGVDSAPSLVALCRARFPAHEWRVGDMRALALERTFDGIVAWDSFFHLTFDDQRAMFPRFRAHAADGAALLFTSGPSHGEAIGALEGEPLYHASLAEEEYRELLRANGFRVLRHVAEDPECGGHTVWLARLESAIPDQSS